MQAVQQSYSTKSTPSYITIDAMKKWQQSHPDLFKKKVYQQAEPDSSGPLADTELTGTITSTTSFLAVKVGEMLPKKL